MNYPKIKTVEVVDNQTLLIEFDNQKKKLYSIVKLFNKPMFAPLKNIALFKSVKIERGGYAIYWNKNIDISEYELWRNGKDFSK